MWLQLFQLNNPSIEIPKVADFLQRISFSGQKENVFLKDTRKICFWSTVVLTSEMHFLIKNFSIQQKRLELCIKHILLQPNNSFSGQIELKGKFSKLFWKKHYIIPFFRDSEECTLHINMYKIGDFIWLKILIFLSSFTFAETSSVQMFNRIS